MREKTFAFVSMFPTYRMSDGTYGIQGSMAGQLLEYKRRLSALFGEEFKVLLVAPSCPEDYYEQNRGNFVQVSDAEIQNALIFPAASSRIGFYARHFLPSLVTLDRVLRPADIVCTGFSYDVFHPISFMAHVVAARRRKKIFYISDGDWRASAREAYEQGTFSLKSYLLCKYVYDPLRALQVRLGVRWGDLVLLKGLQYVKDFGNEQEKVKFYLDSSVSAEHLIPRDVLARKIQEFTAGTGKLRLVYFGRLVHYKGVDYMIDAIHLLSPEVRANVEFHIMGFGEQEAELRAQVERLRLGDCVKFVQPQKYGRQLFDQLYGYHALLACVRESIDTPRSAIDAMAAGMPVIAFDTEYYRSLRDFGAAVRVVPRLSAKDVAAVVARATSDREEFAREFAKARRFAEANTMEIWLDRISRWVHQYCG